MPILRPSSTKLPKFYLKVSMINTIKTLKIFSDSITAMLHSKHYYISVSVLEVRVSNMNTVLNANAELASENRKRHTNTDSSLGAICSLLDTLYGSSISGVSAKQCCYVAHKDTQVGNYMQCLSTASATLIGIQAKGTGTCDQDSSTCYNLAPE